MARADSFMQAKKMWQLTIVGGLAFWATSVATSLLPIAAEYRAAYSNWSAQTVWFASLPMGMIIAGCVSYCLVRWFEAIPTNDGMLKSVILSAVALLLGIILIDIPMSLNDSIHAWRYFVIGAVFNTARYLLLGLAIGYVYKRLNGPIPVGQYARQRR